MMRAWSRPRRSSAGVILNALGWLLTGVAVAALAGMVAVIVIPKAMGWQGVIILSGSMEPALPRGGMAFVEPVKSPESIRIGDIITFTPRPFEYVTHRVVAVQQTDVGLEFVTKGDANPTADVDPVAADRVQAVVRYDIPYLGYLVDALRQRDNYYLIVGVPAVLLVLSELVVIGREMQRYRRRADGGSMAAGDHP